MKNNRLVGSVAVRVTSVLLVTSAILAWGGYFRADSNSEGWYSAGIVLTVLALLGSVHYSRRVYSAWLDVAHRIQAISVTVLFSICFLVVLPLVHLLAWAVDSPKVPSRGGSGSYWIDRREEERTVDFFERMG